MVVQHRHHLRLLRPRRVLEETRFVVSPVVDVRAGQGQVLEDEHAGVIRLPVEIRRQDIGDHAKGIEVGRLRGRDVGHEQR